jgi:hypothetical protein
LEITVKEKKWFEKTIEINKKKPCAVYPNKLVHPRRRTRKTNPSKAFLCLAITPGYNPAPAPCNNPNPDMRFWRSRRRRRRGEGGGRGRWRSEGE